MKRTVLLLSSLLALFGGTARAAIVYSNITTDRGDTLAYAVNGFTQIGDTITLAGTDRYATQATVQFFNAGTNSGTFSATLRLFNIGSPVGSQIGTDYVLDLIAAPLSGQTGFNVAFTVPGVLVPDDLIFTVSVSNQSSGVNILGLDYYEPPTIGSSNSATAIANTGASFITASSTYNLFFELQAETVPEPATIGISAAALAGLLLLRRKALL